MEQYKLQSGILTEKVSSMNGSSVYPWLSPTPGFTEWVEGQKRDINDTEMFDYTIKNKTFNQMMQIHSNYINDGDFASFAPNAKQIGSDAVALEDNLIFGLLNNGFSTTLTYDGKALFADDHACGLSIIDNKSVNVLSATNFRAARAAMSKFKYQSTEQTDAKILNASMDLVLVCGPDLLGTAEDILLTKEISATSNTLYKTAEILSTPLISSSTSWFLINVGSSLKPFFVQEREKVSFTNKTPANGTDVNFLYDMYTYSGRCRMAVLPTLPWLSYGSTGAGS
jgi:phage major head subunit gpT-like protein